MKSARGIRYLFVLMLLLCGMGSAGARYVQADPIGVDGGWNRFTYALANPLGYADEDGLEPTKPAPYIPMSPTPGAGGKSALPDYSRMTIPPAMRGGVGGGRSSTAGASCLSDAAKGGSAVKYGVNDPAVRMPGKWTDADLKAGLQGKPPSSLGRPDLHHADQMPGSGIHEVLPDVHRGNRALHPNKYNQGVTPEMRAQDRQLHWWYRAQEQGAGQRFPDLIYD